MNKLTAEQIKKIEENKRIALQKRLAVQNVGQTSSKVLPPQQPIRQPVKRYPQAFKKPQNASKQETVTFRILSSSKFAVDMVFHEPSVDIMKTLPGRVFDSSIKLWTFPISAHDSLVAKLSTLKPAITIKTLPQNVIQCLKAADIGVDSVDIDSIDPNLRAALMPFQVEGVKFGVSRNGRCLIADDMGLGKTIQALGIAHYFRQSWPLLIVSPSSMRFPWETAILQFLPSVDPFSIIVMTSGSDDIHDGNVVIASYDLLKTCLPEMKKKKFGVIIFDESHFLKTQKSARTIAAMELVPKAKHVILLSGTPALSRPQELFPQINAIDPFCFSSFYDFGMRYCDGKKSRFGWDFSGSSNSSELEIIMKKKFMLRRMKADVQLQLPSKLRKVVILQPKMINKTVSKEMELLASQLVGKRGMERRGKLLEYYCATGIAKLPAVKEYIADKLEMPGKMLVFAHHASVLDGLADVLDQKRVNYIRIDGATNAESRASLCERFQSNPETRVAVLSIKAANSGLTLTAAQLVIFAELYWNPGELTQAEDRAHRIGQRDTVCVEYLIAKGTADDNLWSLVESKLKVLNSVGLSKDSFQNACAEHVRDKRQPLITDVFKGSTEPLMGLSSSQVNMIVDADFDSLQEAFPEDYVFDNIDLDAIEDEPCSKRLKPAL